jgi:hypothetical protein
MARCPYCDYETPEPDDGDAYARGWQEVAHMQVAHPDVISARLVSDPVAFSARFSEEPGDG